MVKVKNNTYPEHPGVAHAERGDICEWRREPGYFRLVRLSDRAVVFGSPAVDINGIKANGQPVTLVGVVAQIKSKGWVLEVEEVKSEHQI